MNAVDFYIREGQVVKDNTVKPLAQKYLKKAKNNLITMSLLYDLNKNKRVREILNIPKEYDSDEWVVICGYYAMYSSALALLAKIGYRSKNHTATILLIEEFFVKKRIISQEEISLLNKALLQKTELEKLFDARHKREIAQYSVTKQTTKEIAEGIKKDAYSFINKVESLIQ